MLQNTWKSGSSFEQVSHPEEQPDPAEQEKQIREGTEVWQSESNGDANRQVSRKQRKSYKWAPQFADVKEAVEKAGRGDGWTVLQGWVRYRKSSCFFAVAVLTRSSSVTPLRANFLAPASLQRGDQAVSKCLIDLLHTFGSIVLLGAHVEDAVPKHLHGPQEMITKTSRPQEHEPTLNADFFIINRISVLQKAICLD